MGLNIHFQTSGAISLLSLNILLALFEKRRDIIQKHCRFVYPISRSVSFVVIDACEMLHVTYIDWASRCITTTAFPGSKMSFDTMKMKAEIA
jgi:hypothetical protein